MASRQRGGDVGDEVRLGALRDLLKQLAADAGDVVPQLPDHARREAAADESPQSAVLRRIHVDHHHAHPLHGRVAPLAERRRAGHRGEDVRVPDHAGDVSVPGDGPEARPSRTAAVRVPEDRRVLAQPGELLVRSPAPSVDIGVDEVDLFGRGHRLPRVLQETIDTTIRPALARTTPRSPPAAHPQQREAAHGRGSSSSWPRAAARVIDLKFGQGQAGGPGGGDSAEATRRKPDRSLSDRTGATANRSPMAAI